MLLGEMKYIYSLKNCCLSQDHSPDYNDDVRANQSLNGRILSKQQTQFS